MTYGLILVFEELRSIIVGNDVHGVPVPSWLAGSVQLGDVMTYPVYRLFISLVCILIALLTVVVKLLVACECIQAARLRLFSAEEASAEFLSGFRCTTSIRDQFRR